MMRKKPSCEDAFFLKTLLNSEGFKILAVRGKVALAGLFSIPSFIATAIFNLPGLPYGFVNPSKAGVRQTGASYPWHGEP